MELELKQHELSFKDRLRYWLIEKLGAICKDMHYQHVTAEAAQGWKQGYDEGKRNAKVCFAVLPLPFTAEELAGRYYGEFITPVGFATQFGECNIPAPGQHGYEQRAYYVSKYDLEHRPSESDLRCHGAAKFHEPENSEELVPVLVTVLR